MKHTIATTYLVFPANSGKEVKKLTFKLDGELVYEMDINIDYETPNFTAYLDLERFKGKTLDIEFTDGTLVFFRESDCIDREDLYREKYRPKYHFTEANGWHNDPNGLVKIGDTYHMFYQQNPALPNWGNMHWGHATSCDLIHWTQERTAIFPDELGAVFSGSGIIDERGVAGFGEGAALFFYTAAGQYSFLSKDPKFTQCLAYSTDGGKTFCKYEDNPIIPHIEANNRDPKVVWCEELDAYVLAIYLEDDRYALFKSDNFKNWKLIQVIVLPYDNECPDFYPLTADDGARKWVFSGAHAFYLVGDIKNGSFVPTQEVRRLNDGGNIYAAQTYSPLPDGRRINVAWETIFFPDNMPFNSQMSIPTVHTLHRDENGYYIKGTPVAEVETLRREKLDVISDSDGYFCELRDSANEILLTVPEKGDNITLSVLGYDITINREKMIADYSGTSLPLTPIDGKFTLRIFTDKCSVEFFEEKHYTCIRSVADETKCKLKLTGESNADITVYSLADIH